ncbi:MAG: thioredoxin [Clostridia bacterium]|nr:thioredoxin [Clostridia bacterium]
MIIHLTKDNFKDALKGNKKILIDFYADWCAPCRMMGAVLEDCHERLSVPVGKVNVDEDGEIAALYGVSSIPTLVLIEDGETKSVTVGALSEAEIKEFVEK